MIKSFKDKNLGDFFGGKSVAKLSFIRKQLARRLEILDAADSVDDLKALPSNRFEYLVGDRKGQCSIRVNIQWRLCFVWVENGPEKIELLDYH